LKSFASKCIYGVSVTRLGFEAGKLVPEPFASVFHPKNEKPVFVNGTFGETEEPLFGDK
jgi:hypothetical protein